MAVSQTFSAPWSVSLKFMTLFGSLLLIGIAVAGLVIGPRHLPAWSGLMVAMPLLIWFAAIPFMILGYRVMGRMLLVKRLGWHSRIGLHRLESVTADPEAMKGSLRTFGNGGLFCFAGRFWSRKLGHYRAYVTDPALAVILKFASRTVVITPDRPRKLVELLSHQIEQRA